VDGVRVRDFGTCLALVWRDALSELVPRNWHLFASWTWHARSLPCRTVVQKVCPGVAAFNAFALVCSGVVRLVLAFSAGLTLGDRGLVQLVPWTVGVEARQDHVEVATAFADREKAAEWVFVAVLLALGLSELRFSFKSAAFWHLAAIFVNNAIVLQVDRIRAVASNVFSLEKVFSATGAQFVLSCIFCIRNCQLKPRLARSRTSVRTLCDASDAGRCRLHYCNSCCNNVK